MGKDKAGNKKLGSKDHGSLKENKKRFSPGRVAKILGYVVALLGVLGITVFDINLADLFKTDYQALAEKKNNEGLNLYESGKYEEAITLYDEVIDLEDKDINDIEMVYFNRGIAQYKLGNYELAVGDFTRAIQIKPRSKYYFNRANAYGQLGDTLKETEDNIKGTALFGD